MRDRRCILVRWLCPLCHVEQGFGHKSRRTEMRRLHEPALSADCRLDKGNISRDRVENFSREQQVRLYKHGSDTTIDQRLKSWFWTGIFLGRNDKRGSMRARAKAFT
jgi:hypothetical protein